MKPTIVDKLYNQLSEISAKISSAEPSLMLTAEESFRKILLLAAASHFESEVVRLIEDMVAQAAPKNEFVIEFVRNKAVSRQYHTYFQWDGNNANSFFGLFGSAFKLHMKGVLDKDSIAVESVKAFMEIGRERNRLVHQNFGAYTLEKSAEEIFQMYVCARAFVDLLSREFPVALECVLKASSDEIDKDSLDESGGALDMGKS